jgi:hypothetical protein
MKRREQRGSYGSSSSVKRATKAFQRAAGAETVGTRGENKGRWTHREGCEEPRQGTEGLGCWKSSLKLLGPKSCNTNTKRPDT